jgi:hypothetical protein
MSDFWFYWVLTLTGVGIAAVFAAVIFCWWTP